MTFRSFTALKHTVEADNTNVNATQFRFLLPGSQFAYLYNQVGLGTSNSERDFEKALILSAFSSPLLPLPTGTDPCLLCRERG